MFGVCLQFFLGLDFAGFVFSAGIANLTGKIAEKKQDVMSKILELFQLADYYHMTYVQVFSGRVYPKFDAKFLAGEQFFFQIGLNQDFYRTAVKQFGDFVQIVFRFHSWRSNSDLIIRQIRPFYKRLTGVKYRGKIPRCKLRKSMTEKRDSDISGLSGIASAESADNPHVLSVNDRSKLFGFRPFDQDEALSLALLMKQIGAREAHPVSSEDGFVHKIVGKYPEGVKVEVYGGVHAESVDVILHSELDNFDDADNIVKKLRKMMERSLVLEENGYYLRNRKGQPSDSKPGLNENGQYRIAYTKALDTRIRERVNAEVLKVVGSLFLDFAQFERDNDKDPESDIW